MEVLSYLHTDGEHWFELSEPFSVHRDIKASPSLTTAQPHQIMLCH